MEKRLFLIDGNSLINRAFYALPPLTATTGEPTNAVYGLIMMLFRLQDDYTPDQILVTFDVSAPTFRHEQYTEYKANRKGMPDDLRVQLPVMKDVLDKLGIPRLELAGYEADDLLGTLAKQGEKEGYNVYVVTGDRDSFQLITPQTKILYTRRGITDTELMDEATLLKNHGVTPKQVQDLKGLMGDSSDNIPGVPGVGEKTALKLLNSYQSIEGVYENLDEIKGKLQERLTEFKDQAYLSRDLATIRLDVPVNVDFSEKRELDQQATYELFQKLGFKTLLSRLGDLQSDQHAIKETWQSEFSEVTVDTWAEFLQDLSETKQIYLGLWTEKSNTLLLKGQKTWVLDSKFERTNLAALQEVILNKEVYCTRGKEIRHFLDLTQSKFDPAFDLELALYCLNPETRWDFTSLAEYFAKPNSILDAKSLEYQVAFLELFAAIIPQLEKELKEHDLWDLYHDLELPLAKVLSQMEEDGILVDPVKLQEISDDLGATLASLTTEIHTEAGEEFNINSPKQLGVILFEKMGLPVLKKTKTGPSTSAEVLEELSEHAIVANVLEYRQVAKLKSTYADALAELISPQTKRIHTTFNQTVTATGRLSSTQPNLQNIPVRTEEGRRIREAFIPAEGSYLLSCDYSQIELRLLAHLSGDQILVDAFRSGQDIHAQTAAEVFSLKLDQVTEVEREAAKAINFGIVYGISSFGLAKGINLTRAEAQEYIDSYFFRYPLVKSYLDSSVSKGEDLGYVETILKRRRYLPGLKSRNFAARNFAARTAMNTPIQGSAADIIKLAMLKVQKALTKANFQTKLLLQVHDELVLEVPEKELDQVARLVKQEMENVIQLDVPLLVDVSYGRNWRDNEVYQFKE